jgi:transposase
MADALDNPVCVLSDRWSGAPYWRRANPRRLQAKELRAITIRYDKTAKDFLAGIHLVASVILLN